MQALSHPPRLSPHLPGTVWTVFFLPGANPPNQARHLPSTVGASPAVSARLSFLHRVPPNKLYIFTCYMPTNTYYENYPAITSQSSLPSSVPNEAPSLTLSPAPTTPPEQSVPHTVLFPTLFNPCPLAHLGTILSTESVHVVNS